jgi:uncharacterized protein (DUF1501 family)
MQRRKFIKNTVLGTAGISIAVNGIPMKAVAQDLFKFGRNAEDRVLVLIRLNGGNDGLNTLIPLDQFDNLVIQRPNLHIPQNNLINLNNNNLALHPSMTGMANMFQNGKLGVIQNVGYPQQNRSHFRSMDIWTSGNIENDASTGWLGRYFQTDHQNYPTNYPNNDYPHPFALSMGFEVSATCQGLVSNFSVASDNVANHFNVGGGVTAVHSGYYGAHIAHINNMIMQSDQYGQALQNVYNAGNSISTLYDANNPMAMHLKQIARLISGGSQTKVYILNLNGFDTHDGQIVNGSPTIGTHANLLKTLSDAIYAFMDDIQLLGLSERVLGMTFSEFGRQIAANASNGTDHGDAAPLFLFGSCLSSQVIGNNPSISNTIVSQAGVQMQYDFRDVYASVLHDWFGVSETDVQALFEHQVNLIPVARACNGNVGIESNNDSNIHELLCYPNPASHSATVSFSSENEYVSLALFSSSGILMKEIFGGLLNPQKHSFQLNISDLPNGVYLLNIRKQSGDLSTRLVVSRH